MKLRGCLFLILILIGAVYLVYLQADLLKYQEVEITGVSEEHLLRVHEILGENVKGANFFAINEKEIDRLISQYAPDLKVSGVKYTFPSKLSIDLKERDQAFVVKASNGKFEVDIENYVMGVSDGMESGIDEANVTYDKPLGSGDTVTDNVLLAGLVYAGLDRKVQIENGEISINLDNGGKVILPSDAAVDKVNELSEVLKKIVQKYTIEGEEIRLIDLRFAKPVIKLN
jgi:cell division septal protein FtsQ